MSDKPATWMADMEGRVRRNLGRVMFTARWVMAPMYLGLLVALVLVVVKFVQKLVQAVPTLLGESSNETIFIVLNLVDLSLVANLVVIVMLAGWENYVGRLLVKQIGDRPEWLSALNFGTVKLRLISSIVAIAGIQILETFVHIDDEKPVSAVLQLAILLGIAVAGLLLALTDRIAESHAEK